MEENKSIFEYFKEVKKLLKKVKMDDKFYSEPSLFMPDATIDPPIITYKIKTREPDRKQTGMKPSIKFSNEYNTEELHGQLFDSEVQYSIYGKNYDNINKTREWFESFLIRHTNKLKKQDIIESVFLRQEEDEVIEINESYYIKQPLIYFVKTPRVFKISFEEIEEIESEIFFKKEL